MKNIFYTCVLFDLLFVCSFCVFAQKNTSEKIDKTSTLSDTERTEMKSILDSSLQKFNASIENLTQEQFYFREAKSKWTIAECIEHIALAELEFPKILEKENQKVANPKLRKKIRIEDDKIRPKMTSRKWKANSPEIFKPSNTFSSVQESITTFQNQRKNTIEYIQTTKDDLRNHFWRHPLTGTIDLYQTLLLMSAHLERHTEQIEKIKSSKNFPTHIPK